MPPDHNVRLAAEQRAQALVDSQLVAASWEVQDKNDATCSPPKVSPSARR